MGQIGDEQYVGVIYWKDTLAAALERALADLRFSGGLFHSWGAQKLKAASSTLNKAVP